MRRYWLRLAILASPLIVWPIIELFVLPIDYFTFRPWEALVTGSGMRARLGAFYPDQHLVKRSIGYYDAYNRVANPRLQYEEWFTDESGFRNRPRAMPPRGYDVLLTGDSNIVGAFNTQDDVLAEQLERACGCAVYSGALGGAVIRTRDGGFVDHPPKVVVSNLTWPTDPLQLLTLGGSRMEAVAFARLEPSLWPTWTLIAADRLAKQAGREWVRSRLRVTELGRWVDYFSGLRGGAARRGETPPPTFGFLSGAVTRLADRVGASIGRMQRRASRYIDRHFGTPPAASPATAAPAAASVAGSTEASAAPAAAPALAEKPAAPIPEEVLAALVEKAALMSDTMRAAGIDVIFLMDPHPNFPMYLPFVERLKARGVGVAYWATWPPENFPGAYWNKEDSHWTARAMHDAAQLIAAEMRARGSLDPARRR